MILCNHKGLKAEYPRKRSVLEYIHQEFQGADAHAEFSRTFAPIYLLALERDMEEQEEDQVES